MVAGSWRVVHSGRTDLSQQTGRRFTELLKARRAGRARRTGSLVAVTDADDAFHDCCVEALKEIGEPLFTLWPVITEAMHIVGSPTAREKVWEVLEGQGLRLLAVDTADIPGVRALMKKYADLAMDLADAALVRVAEREGLHTIFTIDQADFGVYRVRGKRFRSYRK